jgi:hypothetical protein
MENRVMGMSKKLIVVIAGLSLGACSSTGDKNTFMAYGDLQDKVRAHDEQWQSIQPKLDRIDALEAELAALKQGDNPAMPADSMSSNDNIMADESMAAMNVAPAVTAAPLDDQGNTMPMAETPKKQLRWSMLPLLWPRHWSTKNKSMAFKLRPMGTVMKPFVAGKYY